jgi:hypothetical protein
MSLWATCRAGLIFIMLVTFGIAQPVGVKAPTSARVGSPFSIETSGVGKATLYIVGPAGVAKREVQLGEPVSVTPDELHNAGHYLILLAGSGATQSASFDLLPSQKTATVSFLAKPSRLPVNLSNGLSGVVYVFDTFGNLVLEPQKVSFELLESDGKKETRTSTTNYGVGWVRMNSAPKAGAASLMAIVDGIDAKRVVQQVAGDPCSLRMSAKRDGKNVLLVTDPVRDCAGNPVPDGTVVTFTEVYGAREATVDVPLKRGVAQTALPSEAEAKLSVAAGVVMGNEIHWNGGQ